MQQNQLQEMRRMINKNHETDKMLAEITDYAETFDTGGWDFDTWSLLNLTGRL